MRDVCLLQGTAAAARTKGQLPTTPVFNDARRNLGKESFGARLPVGGVTEVFHV